MSEEETGDSLTSGALAPLDPRYKGAFRLSLLIALAFPLAGLALLDFILSQNDLVPWGGITVLAILLLTPIAFSLPARRYAHMGYRVDDDAVLVARGSFFRRETLVPFARIQHLDVQRGPIERAYGLASLHMSTAGAHNGTVVLPGLAPETAEQLRVSIRASIRREPG